MGRTLDIQHVLETSELQDEITRRNAVNRAKLKSLNAEAHILKIEVNRVNNEIRKINLQMQTDYEQYLQLDNLNEQQ
jgi:hypothetical protein